MLDEGDEELSVGDICNRKDVFQGVWGELIRQVVDGELHLATRAHCVHQGDVVVAMIGLGLGE